ncbi:hypothetical protein V5799_016991 [Amblyomma americanum]|uniref:Peptidase M12B domain-containing protein n=1 Tax=Amblyomma americanum TaxID=6943 RepID=A0AAQ4F3D2_AMBAM
MKSMSLFQVNLRYLDMRRPNITFKLVGITRNTDDVFAHEVYDTLEATQTLEGLVKYYKGGNIPGNPDAVYLITGRDLSSIENGVLQKGVAGLAFLGRLCTKLAVAEGEDIAGSYSGVYPMAHELAHILGAEHDESPRCPWSAGYLMSYVDGGTNKYKLSVCSEEQIRRTVLKATDICLRETSKTNYMDQHRKFPGQKLSDVSYCRKMLKQYGGRHNVVTARKPWNLASKCKMRCCFQQGYQMWCQEVDILEGMACSGQRTCRRGVCGNHRWA